MKSFDKTLGTIYLLLMYTWRWLMGILFTLDPERLRTWDETQINIESSGDSFRIKTPSGLVYNYWSDFMAGCDGKEVSVFNTIEGALERAKEEVDSHNREVRQKMKEMDDEWEPCCSTIKMEAGD